MTERFTVHKTIGMFHCFYLNDDLRDKVVMDNIIHKYEADRLCGVLNALHEENQQIKNSIQEAYENERTALGQSVLKQLIDKME